MNPIDRISRARAGMIVSAPFFATLALGLKVEESDASETMATDGERLLFSPAFVDECTDAELRGTIAHECLHVALLHHTRRGGRDARLWNEACDHAVNLALLAEGWTLPGGILADKRFAGMSAEAIFAKLSGEKGQPQGQPQGQPGQPQGQPGQPQGQPGQPQGRTIGDVLDAAPAHDAAALKAAEMDAKARTIQAAQVAAKAGRSSEAGKRAAADAKASPVDWRAVLRRYVDEAARRDYSWSRPNRRHVASGLYLPGSVPDGLSRLTVVIDVSGSIDRQALGVFLDALNAAVADAGADVVDVIQCNTRVTARTVYQHGDEIRPEIVGGGGTDMQPALDAAGDTAAVIVFTDCEFSRELTAPAAPVLWARWGGRGKVPGFGELVDVDAA